MFLNQPFLTLKQIVSHMYPGELYKSSAKVGQDFFIGTSYLT